MNPIAPLLIALDEQLIVILLRAVGYIEQDTRIPNRLLDAHASDIHRASRQVIARWRPAHGLIHLRRAIARCNNDGVVISSIPLFVISSVVERSLHALRLVEMTKDRKTLEMTGKRKRSRHEETEANADFRFSILIFGNRSKTPDLTPGAGDYIP